MKKEELLKAIQVIEHLTGQDACADWEWDLMKGNLTNKEKQMADVIGQVFMIAHSHNEEASCHYVHDDWRKLVPLTK